MRVLVIFLDGVGIGEDDPAANPFRRARMPNLEKLLGGPLPTLDHPRVASREAVAFPLDASLGVEGLPQSGTGQVALLTGENAPAIFGRHFGPWVPVALRPLLEEANLFGRAKAAGHGVTFANAYPRAWRTPPRRAGSVGERRARRLRSAAHPLAAASAEVLVRHREELIAGEAVASDIVNSGWQARHPGVIPDVTAREAGRTLAALSNRFDLCYFAHYSTDTAGHTGEMPAAVDAIERVDDFLGGVIDGLDPATLLIVTSDHGNLEDVRAGHTLNPTLCLIRGPSAPDRAASLDSILQVADGVLEWLVE